MSAVENANLDVAERNLRAVILKHDVAFGRFAKSLQVFELALGDPRVPVFGADWVIGDLLTVEPMRAVTVHHVDLDRVPAVGANDLVALTVDFAQRV